MLTTASAFIAAPGIASAGPASVFTQEGIAIGGADPVAYFVGHSAVAGSATESVMWRGATWLFACRENREVFERDPRRYSPRFGGYCAYTLSQGKLAPTDPRAFAVLDGRLYLLDSLEIRDIWQRNLAQNIKLARMHWRDAFG